MESELIQSTTLSCPNGDGNGYLSMNMTEIYTLEARKQEIANVNKIKAPELMQAFERGYSECAKLLPRIAYELSLAETEADKRKSVVNLDIAPEILKQKGLVNARNPAGSTDMREAVLLGDEEYLKLKDRAEKIRAVHEFMRGKMKGFEMSFSAVKKVYDSLSQYGKLENAAYGFSGGIPDAEVSPDDNITADSIGKPRY